MKALLKFILFLAIVAGAAYAGLSYGQQHPTVLLPSATATPTPRPASAAGLNTFTEPTGGFSVEYPIELTLSKTAPNYPAPVTGARGQVFSFSDSYAENTNLVDATITATKEDGGQAACSKAVPNPAGQADSQSVAIGGRQWLLSTGGDNGAGQAYGYRAYSTVQDIACYRIFLSTHSANVEPKGSMPAFDQAHFEQVLEQMVKSFKP